MKKQWNPAELGDAIPELNTTEVTVKIRGLRHVADDVFLIEGVIPRQFNMEELARALRCEFEDYELLEAAMKAVRRVDMTRILVDRITVA